MASSITAPEQPQGSRTLLKILAAAAVLYLFLVGIGAMGAAFKGMGKSFSEDLLGTGTAAGPLISLFVGILATTLVQSSSTTTSLVVGLVAADMIPFDSAIYMVMGANVGTTVTNTIVSLGHISRSEEYRRAFAAATVHDFFNIIVLLIVFPLEVFTGFLTHLADYSTDAFKGIGGLKLANPIKTITAPAIDVLEWVTMGSSGALAIAGVALTFVGLFLLVRVLKSLMVAKLENLFDRTVFRTPAIALAFGLLLTIIVQSSSITTSLVVPLCGAGVLTIRQAFPYTMGANIGTTFTAVLASLAAYAAVSAGEDISKAEAGLRLAFHHVLFNVVGVAILWPVRGFPIAVADGFARLAMRNRTIPVLYIVFTFYILPFLVVWLGR
jgi:solute carrier family 34 (sodium-dependent phosphate cotransporter)